MPPKYPTHYICGLCDTITDFTVLPQFASALFFHAAVDHRIPLDVLETAYYEKAPSDTEAWWIRLPDRRQRLIIIWRQTGMRPG